MGSGVVDEGSWRELFAAVPAPLYVVDRGGQVRAANRALRTMLGRERDSGRDPSHGPGGDAQADELVGQPATGLLATREPAELEAIHAALDRAFAGPTPAIPARIRRGDGSEFAGALEATAASFAGDEVLVVLIRALAPEHAPETTPETGPETRPDTASDRASTMRRSVEERERIAERLRALGELAAGVAHNFNNALTSVLAHTQVLVRSPELPEWAREDLRVIERVARGAAVTVRRIQSFARSRDPDAVEPSDLADVVANAIALTRPRWNLPDQPGRWTLDWTPSASPLPIVGNGAELCEVIVNLILNGLDAMPEGGALSVATGAEGDRVWVEVRDAGIGIDTTSQRKLFDPFFSTKGRQGLGLGLSVSHGIIDRHGGEISVISEPGKGSAFTLWLPRAEQALEAREPAGPSVLRSAPASTILLVDDDATVRASVAQMLEELGHRVVTAEDGHAALQVLEDRGDLDLLITDLAMPGLDGAGLLRAVAQRFPTLPRILVTGLAADAEAGLSRSADAILGKPLELTALDQTLARLLTRRSPIA